MKWRKGSFSNLSVTSPTLQLILQPFRRFTYVTAHSPTLPLLHLRRGSFSNPSPGEPRIGYIIENWYGNFKILSYKLFKNTKIWCAKSLVNIKVVVDDGQILELRSETSPSVEGWMNMIWMIHYGHVRTGDECGPNFLTLVLRLMENPEKPSTRKLIRPGIAPGPAAWLVTVLPTDHSVDLIWKYR